MKNSSRGDENNRFVTHVLAIYMFVVQINYQNVFIIFVEKYMTSFLFLEFLILDISEFVGFHSYILLNQALDFMPLGHKYDISIFLSKVCTLSMFTPDHLY